MTAADKSVEIQPYEIIGYRLLPIRNQKLIAMNAMVVTIKWKSTGGISGKIGIGSPEWVARYGDSIEDFLDNLRIMCPECRERP